MNCVTRIVAVAAAVLSGVVVSAAKEGKTDAAKAPSYKAGESFKIGSNGGVAYMAVTHDDKICVLGKDGAVKVFDTSGAEIASFASEPDGNACAIAVDDTGNIYVVSSKLDWKKWSRRSTESLQGLMNDDRAAKKQTNVTCMVFDRTGMKEATHFIEDAYLPTAAKIIKDKLVIADAGQGSLLICDPKTCKINQKISKDIRLCCGIFDFCEGPDETILVANLAQFKVSSYDHSGSPTGKAFGKRGKEVNDFHGCCNPVNVALLPDGSIATVEKDPTRVKVYDKDGKSAMPIEGIGELVKGCRHIPMVVDSKGNLYLVSALSDSIVKCVPAAAQGAAPNAEAQRP